MNIGANGLFMMAILKLTHDKDKRNEEIQAQERQSSQEAYEKVLNRIIEDNKLRETALIEQVELLIENGKEKETAYTETMAKFAHAIDNIGDSLVEINSKMQSMESDIQSIKQTVYVD